MIFKRFRIHGLVQGVFYRKSAKEKAAQLGLIGFVKNEADGSVLAEAGGEQAVMDEFERWCHKGPPASRVEKVLSEEIPPFEGNDFRILREE